MSNHALDSFRRRQYLRSSIALGFCFVCFVCVVFFSLFNGSEWCAERRHFWGPGFFLENSNRNKKKNAIFFSPIAQTKKSKRTNHEINGTVLGAPFRCVFVLFFDFFCFKFWPKREKKKRRRSVLSLRRTTLKIGRRLADNLRFVSCTTLRGPLLFCFCCLVFLFCFFFLASLGSFRAPFFRASFS